MSRTQHGMRIETGGLLDFRVAIVGFQVFIADFVLGHGCFVLYFWASFFFFLMLLLLSLLIRSVNVKAGSPVV